MPDFRSALTLPAHPAAATVARAYAREMAALAELADADADRLADATATACRDLVAGALAPGEPDALALTAVVSPSALVLAIRERGAPFDPAATGPGAGSPVRGRDWEQIRKAVDEARWASRGNAGMELTLTRQRPLADVTRHVTEAALTPFRADEPLAPPQTYDIRRLRPEDAVGVAQCVYRSYGYTYSNPDLYYPERIVHLNESGHLVSVVALDASGAVVGHLALERPDLGRVAESGQAVVSPAHRGRHLLERLHERIQAEARGLGLVGIVGYTVTSHVFSQRMEESAGAHLCGVALGQIPQSLTFRQIADAPAAQRGSTMFYFTFMESPRPTRVYAPLQHRPMLERIYAALAVPVEWGPPAGPRGRGHVTASLDRAWDFGEIHVDVVGEDTAAEIRRARRDLCETAGVQVVYLFLPLTQPGTPELCAAVEADGFFWSGVGPSYAADGDMLCLQYLAVELDLALIQVAGQAGRDLLEYVAAERRRVTRSG
jgi:hypothetical protein